MTKSVSIPTKDSKKYVFEFTYDGYIRDETYYISAKGFTSACKIAKTLKKPNAISIKVLGVIHS